MFRMWGKIIQNNHMIRDSVYLDPDPNETRTHKIFHGLEFFSREFDLPIPIWLDKNIREFQRISKTRFYQDSFLEHINFDYLEIHIIEEDDISF